MVFSPINVTFIAGAAIILVSLWRWKLRRIAFLIVAILLIGGWLIILQKPWRRADEIHIVGSTSSSGIPISVVQVHDGFGLNSSYVVARENANCKWKWFCIGNDDFYWYQVKFRQRDNGNVQVIKYGKVFAVFSPNTFRLRWFDVQQSPSYETTELLETRR